MNFDFRLPNISGNDKEQLAQIRSYLYQFVPQLQWAFSSATTDYVEEVGTINVDDKDTAKGQLRYRKWNSGAVDFNGVVRVTPSTNKTIGPAYYSNEISIALPFSLSELQLTGSTDGYTLVGNSHLVDGNKMRFRLCQFSEFTDNAVSVRIIASGTTK